MFELSQRIHTRTCKREILDFIEERLRKATHSTKVKTLFNNHAGNRSDESVTVKNIINEPFRPAAPYLVSSNETTGMFVLPKASIAGLFHSSSRFFLLIFTWVFWILPILWLKYQEKNVRIAVMDVLARIKDEFDSNLALAQKV